MTLSICKYKLSKFSILFPDSTTVIAPKNVTGISINKSYYENMFPLLSISFTVDLATYKKINRTKNIKYKLIVDKAYVNNTNTNYNENTLQYKRFLDLTLMSPNDKDENIAMSDENINKSTDKKMNEEYNENELRKNNISMELYLFIDNHIHRYKKNITAVINSGNIMDAIMYSLYVCKMDNVLISYPDNKKIYNNIILSGKSFLGTMRYLQNIYGIYNTGLIIFNDFNTMYILNKNPKCTAKRKSEITKVYMLFNDKSTVKGNEYGFTRDLINNKIEIQSTEVPDIKKGGTATNELTFDNMTMINSNNGSYYSKSVDIGESTSNYNKYFDNRYNNGFGVNSMKYEMEQNNKTLTVKLNEVDIDFLAPNKEYYFRFNALNYTNYNGYYKLVSVNFNLSKTNDTLFDCGGQAVFKSI